MKYLFSILSMFLFSIFNEAKTELVYNYVDNYHQLAVVEMYRSGIPASITLAQGLHESNMGNSKLAKHANNHFGIKCKSYWKGKRYAHKDDDYKNGKLIESCFRSYDSVLDSYIDHTNFLMTTKHYKTCFKYDRTDYKNWARSLKACGYATDKKYANTLIRYIETYSLYMYDNYADPTKL